MSAINTKIKTFILTAISAAILSACGGGGGGGNAALPTGSTNTAGSGSPEKKMVAKTTITTQLQVILITIMNLPLKPLTIKPTNLKN